MNGFLSCSKCPREESWPNWPKCDRADCPERPIAREVLSNLRERIAAATAEPNPAWLIEIDAPMSVTLYYCDEGDWCSNPNHAYRFAMKAEAEAIQSKMRSDLTRVAEHEWSTPGSQKQHSSTENQK